MKNVLSVVVCLFCFIYSCKNKQKSEVIIKGNGFDKSIKKVYLTENLKWDVFLDSADCVDGRFELKYKPSNVFEPFYALIVYLDSNNRKKSFFVRNEILMKKDDKKHAPTNTFMLDYGITSFFYYHDIERYAEGIFVNIKGGAEEELFQEYDERNFGWIPKVRNEARERRFKEIVKKIEHNSFSFYFLKQITSNRAQYSKDELKKILSYFDEDVQKSKTADRLKEHIINSLDNGENTRSLSLNSDKGIIKKDINKTAKLNMLIFWASWCGPCRLEIPQLKKINDTFKNKDFYMASISIDRNKKDWDKALIEEKLDWDQFIVNNREIDKIKSQYNFSAIPLVVFTNRDGKELARYSGYSEGHVSNYQKIISDSLYVKIN